MVKAWGIMLENPQALFSSQLQDMEVKWLGWNVVGRL